MDTDPLVGSIRSALTTVEDPELGPDMSPERMSDDAKFLLGVYG